MAEEGIINRRALAALIVILILIMTPLAVLYIMNDEEGGEVVFTLSKEWVEGSEIELTIQDLTAMDQEEGEASYQNFFNNWKGHGTYRGVKVADLVELLGGMVEGDNITVTASDGYNQTYCWRNVLNEWPDPTIQGDMVLAYEFNGTSIPKWEEGPMIVFLPPEGEYSNQDCLETSCEGQGGNVYHSAGARWVRNAGTLVLKRGETGFTFAVMGDSQGNNLVLEAVIEGINSKSADLVLHLGDTVLRATTELLDTFNGMLSELEAELRVTPGNHDVMLNDTMFYEYFDTGDYYFDRGDCRFISIDSSAQDISDDQFGWLREVLSQSIGKRTIVFSHVPSYDPREGEDHHLNDPENCLTFREIIEEYGVDIVLNGHVHMFNHTLVNGTDYFITGGAGGTLYAEPEDGGYHHFILFNVTADSIDWEVVMVEPQQANGTIEIVDLNSAVHLTFEDLISMDYVEGFSSYQNQCSNWRGEGCYRGVVVSDLIELYEDGELSATISASTENDGSFSWVIPEDQAVGDDYRIKIVEIDNPEVFDMSDADFEVFAASNDGLSIEIIAIIIVVIVVVVIAVAVLALRK